MSHLHPMLRHNFRAGSSTLIGRESASDIRPAQASSGSSRYGPSDPRPNARDVTSDKEQSFVHSVTQQYIPVLQVLVKYCTYSVRTCTASTPGQLVAHPPETLVYHLCQFHLLIFDSHPLLCGSLRYHIHLFPSVPFIFTTTCY